MFFTQIKCLTWGERIEQEGGSSLSFTRSFWDYFRAEGLALVNRAGSGSEKLRARTALYVIMLQIFLSSISLLDVTDRSQVVESLGVFSLVYALIKILKHNDAKNAIILESILISIVSVVCSVVVVIFAQTVAKYVSDSRKWVKLSPLKFISADYEYTLNDLGLYLDNTLILNTEVKNKLICATSDFKFAQVMNSRANLLFTGPPGVGKTESAEKIIKYLGGGYKIYITRLLQLSPDLISSIFHTMAEKMRSQKLVLFFDDGETGLLERKSIYQTIPDSEIEDDAESQRNKEFRKSIQVVIGNILSLLGGSHNIYVIFTTNLTDGKAMDVAHSRRFSHVIYFENPNKENRKKIIWRYVKPHQNLSNFFFAYNKDMLLNKLSDVTENMSGRELRILVNNFLAALRLGNLSIESMLDIVNHRKNIQQIQRNDTQEESTHKWVKRNVEPRLHMGEVDTLWSKLCAHESSGGSNK